MMSYKTRWFPGTVPSGSPNSFLWEGLKFYLRNVRPRHFLTTTRTVEKVRSAYDASRGSLLEKLDATDWDTYIYGPEDEDFTLLDDRVVWSGLREARSQVLERIVEAVARYSSAGKTVVEFGSGDGRNLVYLKKRFPDVNFVGLELSPVSVELSKGAAEKFGVEVSFYVADICDRLPAGLPPRSDVSLAYSCFALEMIPRNSQRAIENMIATSSGAVVFFEPVSELWPWGLRGVVSRLRVAHLNRLTGFMPGLRRALRACGWSLQSARRMRVSHNPLNEGGEIHLHGGAGPARQGGRA